MQMASISGKDEKQVKLLSKDKAQKHYAKQKKSNTIICQSLFIWNSRAGKIAYNLENITIRKHTPN